MSTYFVCKNCERTMFTPSGFCPPSPGSLMVHSYTQCEECHDKGLPDLAPPPDPNAKTYSVPYTPTELQTFEIKAPIKTWGQMARDAEESGKRSPIDCAFCGVKLFIWPVTKCENGHSASFLAQSMERARKRMIEEISLNPNLVSFEQPKEKE